MFLFLSYLSVSRILLSIHWLNESQLQMVTVNLICTRYPQDVNVQNQIWVDIVLNGWMAY